MPTRLVKDLSFYLSLTHITINLASLAAIGQPISYMGQQALMVVHFSIYVMRHAPNAYPLQSHRR